MKRFLQMIYLIGLLSVLNSQSISLTFIIPKGFKLNSGAPAALTLTGPDIDTRTFRYSFGRDDVWSPIDPSNYPVRLTLNRLFSETDKEVRINILGTESFEELVFSAVLCDAADESLCYFLEDSFQPGPEDYESGSLSFRLSEPAR